MSIPFQTTVKAAGHILEAERIARLCWEKLQCESKARNDHQKKNKNNIYSGSISYIYMLYLLYKKHILI